MQAAIDQLLKKEFGSKYIIDNFPGKAAMEADILAHSQVSGFTDEVGDFDGREFGEERAMLKAWGYPDIEDYEDVRLEHIVNFMEYLIIYRLWRIEVARNDIRRMTLNLPEDVGARVVRVLDETK
jgi:hypothetical protein